MPRQLDIRLQDGGMHFVAHLRGRTDDMELVERLRRKGIGPGPLSLHAIRRNAPNGLMIGYPNVPERRGACCRATHAGGDAVIARPDVLPSCPHRARSPASFAPEEDPNGVQRYPRHHSRRCSR